MPKLSPDEKWRRYNQELTKFMKEDSFWMLEITYFKMANQLKEEKGSVKEIKKLKKLGNKMKLIHHQNELKNYFRSSVVRGVEILADQSSCKKCKKLDGKEFSLQKALKENPLPVNDCEHYYGCRCVYLPII